MPSILVAENNTDARNALCEILRLDGFEARGVANASSALALLQEHIFDLLITELAFPAGPRTSGLEIIRKLRENTRTAALPIIVVTAYDDRSELQEAYDSGANVVFVKPVEDMLFAAVEALLGDAQFNTAPSIIKPAFDLIRPVVQSIEVINARLSSAFRDHPERLRLIDPFRFEHLIAELFEDEEYE
jgi:CheY-like chemotaxis protein